jgi:hypothetical protein
MNLHWDPDGPARGLPAGWCRATLLRTARADSRPTDRLGWWPGGHGQARHAASLPASDRGASAQAALERCNGDAAPWYLVPADRKWYRDWAIAKLLAEQLEDMKLTWPKADLDVEQQRTRLLADS